MPRLRSDEPAAAEGCPEEDAVIKESVDVSCHGTYALLYPNCVQYFLYAASEMPLVRVAFLSSVWTSLQTLGRRDRRRGFGIGFGSVLPMESRSPWS